MKTELENVLPQDIEKRSFEIITEGVFTNAVLPSAMSQIISWTGMRFEINFSECAILGMVGAGGIGFVISSSIQGYDYGTAGLAIFIVFIFAFVIERVFVRIKEHIR